MPQYSVYIAFVIICLMVSFARKVIIPWYKERKFSSEYRNINDDNEGRKK